MRTKLLAVYKTLSVVFALLAIFTFLKAGEQLHFVHTIAWVALGYGALNLLMAWGLWYRERWVLCAAALNLAGTALLLAVRLYRGVDSSTMLLLAMLANGLLLWFLNSTRKKLADSAYGDTPWIVFCILWAIMFLYTIGTILHVFSL